MFWVTLIFSVFNSLIKILDNNCSNSVAGATYSIFVSILGSGNNDLFIFPLTVKRFSS